ncbi:MAG: histidine kinase, partial [Melioribacteraceae bacterium]
MKYLPKYYLSFFFASIIFAQKSEYNVTIQVIAEVEDSAKVYIVGNVKEFGSWNPSKVELEKIDNKTWRKNFSFPQNTTLEFKFTTGSWANEALTNEKTVPSNYILKVEHDTTFQTEINYWKENTQPENVFKGQITGTVKYHKSLKWEGLKSRDVIVWLPPGYEENIYERYPVLYMHDGQNIVDPKTSTFGIDWQIDEAADSLIKQNKIHPIIIVGIYNTADRSSEYKNIDSGFSYMDFVINKLKPLIDKTYRTKPDRENTANGGSSLAVLTSLMFVWEHPEIFSKAICMSPAFKISNIDYVSSVEKYSGESKNVKLYFYNGGITLEERLQPGIDEMIKVLLSKGFELNKDLYFVKDKNAEHNESSWAKKIPEALK